MIKIGIITINDYNNYGNRLQNYAVQSVIEKINNSNINIITIVNGKKYNFIKGEIKKIIKIIIMKKGYKRHLNFFKFNKNILFSRNIVDYSHIPNNLNSEYNYFIVGSDQVWNPNFDRLSDVDLLSFVEPSKRISFSASFGISELPKQYHEKVKKELSKFKAISVREDAGKKIIEDVVGRNDVEVLVDPTMLLNADEWDKVSKKPKMLKNDKFILNYFLGELSEQRKNEINRVAKENDCEVINILDKNSPFYECGPSEFLYLEKHAFLICTDSFHSSVFAILYNRPFIVFDREDNIVSMNSRLETLLSKFKLENRKYSGTITKNDLSCNYQEAYKILDKEKEKSIKWLKKALDIE